MTATEAPTILVTGANGYIAASLIHTLLGRGFQVRGTVRSVAKHPWTTSQYGPGYTVVEVPEISSPDTSALADAVKGVSYIAHVASGLLTSPNPHEVVPVEVRAALNVLEAAQKENEAGGNVKSVVYTSSRTAAINHVPGEAYHQSPESWNEYALKEAWEQPWDKPTMKRMMLTYACAKTTTEQKMFEWVKTHKPSFTFNTVIGSVALGNVPAWRHMGFCSSSSLTKMLWDGDVNVPLMVPAEYHIDIEDMALAHLAALTFPDVNDERLMVEAKPYSWNMVLDLYRKFAPGREFLKEVEDAPWDIGVVTNERAEELLRRLKGGKGFESLEEVIEKFVRCVLQAEKEGGIISGTSGDRLMAAVEGKKEVPGKQPC